MNGQRLDDFLGRDAVFASVAAQRPARNPDHVADELLGPAAALELGRVDGAVERDYELLPGEITIASRAPGPAR